MHSFCRTIVVVASVFLGNTLAAAQQPPSPSAILDEAKNQAAVGQRAIFAIFHASW